MLKDQNDSDSEDRPPSVQYCAQYADEPPLHRQKDSNHNKTVVKVKDKNEEEKKNKKKQVCNKIL